MFFSTTRMIWRFTTIVLCFGMIQCTQSSADTVFYPDMDSATVDFYSIFETYTPVPAHPLPRYGEPSELNDVLTFPADEFRAQALNSDIDLIAGRATVSISAHPGMTIDSIDVSAFGAKLSVGANALSQSQIVAFVIVDGQTYSNSFLRNFNGNQTGNWTDNFTINFPDAQNVKVVLESQLLARAEGLEAAYIDFSSIIIGVNSVTAVVPEPGSAFLTFVGVTGLFFSRRRRA